MDKPAPRLLDLQLALSRCLTDGDAAPVSRFIAPGGIAPEARLNVYRNTMRGTLATALRLAFPAVQGVVGAEFFAAVAQLFIEQRPAGTANLHGYGVGFPEFLEQLPAAAPLPYLPGVARVDWAVHRALHAPDEQPLPPEALARFETGAWGRLRLLPHPSAGLVQSAFPVDDVWRATLMPEALALEAVDLDSGPVWLLIGRRGEETLVERLREADWRITRKLFGSEPLAVALEGAADADAAALLGQHLACGRFVGFLADGAGDSNPQPGWQPW
jgi:hypothetical protein